MTTRWMGLIMGAVLATSACGGKSAPQGANDTAAAPPAATPAPAEASTAPRLPLADISMTVEGEPSPPQMRVDASGKVWVGAEQAALLTPAGEVQNLGGEVVATLGADGVLAIPGTAERITIREDGALLKDGAVLLEFTPDGALTGPMMAELGDRKVTVAGPPEARRAMMLAWVIAMVPAESTTR